VTILKHCRCIDCRKFHADGSGNYYCDSGIGGTATTWATGKRECDPPPDAWHYCSDYHGPQISKDVWVWPRHQAAEVVAIVGPPGDLIDGARGGNGSQAGLFRSTARTQGKEA